MHPYWPSLTTSKASITLWETGASVTVTNPRVQICNSFNPALNVPDENAAWGLYPSSSSVLAICKRESRCCSSASLFSVVHLALKGLPNAKRTLCNVFCLNITWFSTCKIIPLLFPRIHEPQITWRRCVVHFHSEPIAACLQVILDSPEARNIECTIHRDGCRDMDEYGKRAFLNWIRRGWCSLYVGSEWDYHDCMRAITYAVEMMGASRERL